MLVSVASEASRPGATNLDWVGTTNQITVVLDGLTESPETGCHHGTAWYVRQLGCRLLALASDDDRTLAESLAKAIDAVADLHATDCDLSHPGSPCTTVAMIRQRSSQIDYLVLADSAVILDRVEGPTAIIDETEKTFSAELEEKARGGTLNDFTALIHDQQQYRNQPGGYWVAQANSDAAKYALTGTVTEVQGAVLASDGAMLLVTDFRMLTWRGFVDLAYRVGPSGLISQTRELERADPERIKWPRYKVSDDATAAVCRM